MSDTHSETISDYQRKIELLEKALIQLQNGKNSEAVVAELATKLTNKFMHAPTSALQSAAQGGELDKLLYLRDIFNIDRQA